MKLSEQRLRNPGAPLSRDEEDELKQQQRMEVLFLKYRETFKDKVIQTFDLEAGDSVFFVPPALEARVREYQKGGYSTYWYGRTFLKMLDDHFKFLHNKAPKSLIPISKEESVRFVDYIYQVYVVFIEVLLEIARTYSSKDGLGRNRSQIEYRRIWEQAHKLDLEGDLLELERLCFLNIEGHDNLETWLSSYERLSK